MLRGLYTFERTKKLPMNITRRKIMLASAGLPLLASCAHDMARLREKPVAALAKELDVCSASYVVLRAGKAEAPVSLNGCTQSPQRTDGIFQAAFIDQTSSRSMLCFA